MGSAFIIPSSSSSSQGRVPSVLTRTGTTKTKIATTSFFATNEDTTEAEMVEKKRKTSVKENKLSTSHSRRGHFNLTSRRLLAALVVPSLVSLGQENRVNAAQEGELSEEFLALDKKKQEFRKKQIEIRKDWDEEIATFMTLRDEKSIIDKMGKLINIIRVAEGLPLGVTKKEMVSKMRTVKKAGKQEGFWTTEVEKAYQSYIRAVDYVQSPNTDRQI